MKKQASSLRRAVQARRGSSGFTLIEVMIVVAIIGILASIAIPAYNDYVRRGQLPEAFNTLSEYRVKMEQYYQDNRKYGTTDCADASSASGWNTFPTTVKYFTFTCALDTATGDTAKQSYTITATGASSQAVGHVYTINERGQRATTKFKNATVSQSCWLSSAAAC
ncbi:type IV pilin protein [Variovorax paradoxus]|uniref:type IV pilin protein n=1 Tax=Variovorax paradoxus TaxID=34073 RepID=UPI0029C96896|nr:type IV pilin protein [Variovorax paradoxus]WPH20438.1 type IV pilin protein [Variovorax paradoxus]